MSDPVNTPVKKRFGDGWMDPTRNNIVLICILNFIGCFIIVAGVIAAISAFSNRDKADDLLKTHYAWEIRTFWGGVVLGLVAYGLTFSSGGMTAGLYGYGVLVAWLVIRSGISLYRVWHARPMPGF